MVDAAAVTVTPVRSLDLTRGVAKVELADVAVPAERVLDGLDRRRGPQPGRDPVRRGGRRASRRGAYRRGRVRQGAGAVRPADRPVPGRQAQVRPHARRAGAGPRHGLGRRPRRRRAGRRARLRRAGVAAAGWSPRTPPCSAPQDAIQELRRHRLHLRARRPPLLPPGADAARAARLRRPSGPSGWPTWRSAGSRRAMEIDLPEDAEPLREGIRAEIAEIAALEGKEQRRALADAGCVMPHLPKPWGRDASPLEQVLIHAGAQGGQGQAAADDHRRLGGAVARRVRHAGAAGALPAADAARRDDLVPAVLRARRGLRPRLAAHQAEKVEGGWKLNGQKIWTSRGARRRVGHLHRPHRLPTGPSTRASPTSSST